MRSLSSHQWRNFAPIQRLRPDVLPTTESLRLRAYVQLFHSYFLPLSHAPAWGATVILIDCFFFQLTHPRGVHLPYYVGLKDDYKFQLTHPRGVQRRFCYCRHWIYTYFNSRTRVGCNYLLSRVTPWFIIFQLTHPRGVQLKNSL